MDTSSLNPILLSLSQTAWTAFGLGILLGGTLTAIVSLGCIWLLAKRLHRLRILDHTRFELKSPVTEYIEWLHALTGEFPQWRRDLIPGFQPNSNRSQFELNRMRKLFVDPRSSNWFARLEEYELLLTKFNLVIQKMWRHQADIGERFHRVLSHIEDNTATALGAAEELEELAFEQAQLSMEFMDHLQYECLKNILARRPKIRHSGRNRIKRTVMGKIKVVQPMLQL